MFKLAKLIFTLFLFMNVTLWAQEDVAEMLKNGPVEKGSPIVLWGSSCLDTDNHVYYWFGGSGGVSKTGGLLTYELKGNKWEEVQFNDESKVQLNNELKVIENELRDLYTCVANRYYQSELEAEKKIKFIEKCKLVLDKLLPLEDKILNKDSKEKYSQIKNDLESFLESLKSNVIVKHVANSRKIYRDLVQLRWSLDVQPSARNYSNMVYDSSTKKIILFGGEGLLGVYSDTWLFDTKEKKWQQVFPKVSPTPRCGHGMVAQNGSVYVVAGFNARGSLSYCTGLWNRLPLDVWRYDIVANTWVMLQKPVGKPTPTSMQPAYSAIIESNKLIFSGDKISYGKKVGSDQGELNLPAAELEGEGVGQWMIQVRDSGYDPAWYEAVPEPDAKAFAETLKNLPENTWVNVAPPVCHVNRDWGTTVLDLKRDQLLHWAGGHSSHNGTDVAHYSLSLNRWHIAYTPELPFETVYSNDGAKVPSMSGRPWSSHTYLSYAIDSVTDKMLWAGKHASYKVTNPSMSFLYDPTKYEWVDAEMGFEGDKFDVERHKTCMVPTPYGIACWGDKRGGTGGQTGLWIADIKAKKFLPIAGTDPKDSTTFPNSAYGDRHGITYDSKRDRVLIFHFGIKEKFNIWSCNLKTKEVSVLNPTNSDAFPMEVSFGREATYIPEYDIVYVPTSGGKQQFDLIYDCNKNEWLELTSVSVKNEKGKYKVVYGVSTGIEWDPKRKLLWLVQTTGSVYTMRLNLSEQNLSPLKKKEVVEAPEK